MSKFIVVKVFQDYDTIELVKFVKEFDDEVSASAFITSAGETYRFAYAKKEEYIHNFLEKCDTDQQWQIVTRFYPKEYRQTVLLNFEAYHPFWQLFQYDGKGNYPVYENIQIDGFNNIKLPEEDGYNLFVVEINNGL